MSGLPWLAVNDLLVCGWEGRWTIFKEDDWIGPGSNCATGILNFGQALWRSAP